MSGKRKRRQHKQQVEETSEKRRKLSPGQCSGHTPPIQHALLSLYYPTVLSLYDYVLSRLSSCSNSRRRKVLALRYQQQNASRLASDPLTEATASDRSGSRSSRLRTENERLLAKLLATTLIGVLGEIPVETNELLSRDILSFSQQLESSAGSGLGSGSSTQSEVCVKIL